MQLSKETINFLYSELNEMVIHCDLTEKQFDEIPQLMGLLHRLYFHEPVEITLADE